MSRKEYNAEVYAAVIDGALCIMGCIVVFALAISAADAAAFSSAAAHAASRQNLIAALNAA